MVTKQEQRSEETKNSILTAAGKLFASRGYDTVTMREIAKEAGCSHTTIYIYFKDKEALLHQLSMPPLQILMHQMDILLKQSVSSDEKLKGVSLGFIAFCLTNRSMYTLFFNVKSVRVDEEVPELEINKVRNELFGRLTGIIQACLQLNPKDERLLMFTRIYFFTLHGIVATYKHSEEQTEQLMGRLTQTFQEAFEVLLSGIKHQLEISRRP
jgi:AcrR family transcriptional regulator